MSEPCPHENLIKQSTKELFGNGNKGLIKEFVELKTEFKEMNASVNNLATSYSALVKSQIENDAIKTKIAETENQKVVNIKYRNAAIQKVGVIFGIIFGVVSTIYLVLNYFS